MFAVSGSFLKRSKVFPFLCDFSRTALEVHLRIQVCQQDASKCGWAIVDAVGGVSVSWKKAALFVASPFARHLSAD